MAASSDAPILVEPHGIKNVVASARGNLPLAVVSAGHDFLHHLDGTFHCARRVSLLYNSQ